MHLFVFELRCYQENVDKMKKEEKEKCLKKMNEMQSFLPFLDFMIDKIKNKHVTPLEGQLSKFQHIRSVIYEKNEKYSLENLTNLEDILQKLITKLEYKGPSCKSADVESGQTLTSNPMITEGEKLSEPALTPTNPLKFDCSSDSTYSLVQMVMKDVDLRSNQSTVLSDKQYTGKSRETNGQEARSAECSKSSKAECQEKRLNESWNDTCSMREFLASSREKLITLLSGKVTYNESVTLKGNDLDSLESKSVKSTQNSDKKKSECVTQKSDKGKEIRNMAKNRLYESLCDELSDISDDDMIVSDDNESYTQCSVKHLNDKSKSNNLFDNAVSNSANDASSKQKLRQKLSVDIAALHKVPGKSVGGSLRTLKNEKNLSNEGVQAKHSKEKNEKEKEFRTKERRGDQNAQSHNKNRDVSITQKHSLKDKERKYHKGKDNEYRSDSGFIETGESEHKSNEWRKSSENKKKIATDKVETFINESQTTLQNLAALQSDELRKKKHSFNSSDFADLEEGKNRKGQHFSEEFIDRTSRKRVNEECKSGGPALHKPNVACSKGQLSNLSSSGDVDKYTRKLIENTTSSVNVHSEFTSPELSALEESIENNIRLHPFEGKLPIQECSYNFNSSAPTQMWGQSQSNETKCQKSQKISDPRKVLGVSWNKNCRQENTSTNLPYLPKQGSSSVSVFECNKLESNNAGQAKLVQFSDQTSSGNIKYTTEYNYPVPKSYGEYKQMKRQEMMNSNKFRLNYDDRSRNLDDKERIPNNDTSVISSSSSSINAVKFDEKKSMGSKSCVSDSKNDKSRYITKTTPSNSNYGSRRKSFEDNVNEDKTDKSKKLNSPDDGLVFSPLNKLYTNDPKPTTGRGYGLQNFKIPKKSWSSSNDGHKQESKQTTELQVEISDETKNEEEPKDKCTTVIDSIGTVTSEMNNTSTKQSEKNDSVTNTEHDVNNVNSNKSGTDDGNSKYSNDEKDDSESAKVNCSTNNEETAELSSINTKIKDHTENSKADVKEGNTNDKKSSITEEITQELVEALITKSFESGEGELLLAKARLFKELALKLNSKKLKTIQKIINSESDSNSSSSESSIETKKKAKKKKGGDYVKRREKRKKSSRIIIYSSDEDHTTSKEEENDVHEEQDSGKSSKNNQRKTKLLKQVLEESPNKNLTIITNQNQEKDIGQKTKPRTVRATELDRLHEDIRNMFICSGVVTATGQRMCRILRESGGKVNNLDLVKESAKMVEEEKLTSMKSCEPSDRSKGLTSDRKSKTRSINNTKKRKKLYPTKNLPVVTLANIDIEQFSRLYVIPGYENNYNVRKERNVARRGRRNFVVSERHKEMQLNMKRKIYLFRNLQKWHVIERHRNKSKHPKKLRVSLADVLKKLSTTDETTTEYSFIKPPERTRINEPKPKMTAQQVNLLDYAFDRNETIFKCRICDYNTKSITSHYKSKHPESEVLISRLSKLEAEKAISDSKSNNYDSMTLDKSSALDEAKSQVDSAQRSQAVYNCRMCKVESMTSTNQFFNHVVSSHTGEYRYQCSAALCDLHLATWETVKDHMRHTHDNEKYNCQVVELYPLPVKEGTFFGYLCSSCNYVQIFRHNVESHIQRNHGNDLDVRIIKIDLSHPSTEVKPAEEQENKSHADEDDSDCMVCEIREAKKYSSVAIQHDSATAESIEGDIREETTIDQLPRISLDAKDVVEVNVKQTQTVNNVNNVEAKISKDIRTYKRSTKPNMRVVKKTLDSKAPPSNKPENSKGKKWVVGPFKSLRFDDGTVKCKCNMKHCNVWVTSVSALKLHVTEKHSDEIWTKNYERECCTSSDQTQKPRKSVKLLDLVHHLETHIQSTVTPNQINMQPEVITSKVKSKESSFPQKPLLRVRNFIGDRLSMPKSPLQDNSTVSKPQNIEKTGETNNSAGYLFTMKDVRSLKPDQPTSEAPKIQNYPPNAEVVGDKPVIIRSCPSPKIMIRSEPTAIPISVAAAKQAVEIGHLKVVPPPGAPIELVAGNASIRILTPQTFTKDAVIFPTSTNAPLPAPSGALPKPGAEGTIAVSINKTQIVKPSEQKQSTPQLPIEGPVQNVKNSETNLTGDNTKKNRLLLPKPPPQPTENPVEKPNSSLRFLNSDLKGDAKPSKSIKKETPLKNLKNASVYKEMLKKDKLCQLFKCMAVECSFTTNSDVIFTQHLGLHEVQSRIKKNKLIVYAGQKMHFWQQCAYCCELLLFTGPCLSEHILTNHGHCLYQCSYCFYRAICRRYVELHQKTVHKQIFDFGRRVIYKCKPVPGVRFPHGPEKYFKPQYVKPYICEICKTKFYVTEQFIEHLGKEHQSVSVFSCHICKILCLKAHRLVSHYKLHSFNMYQCVYCLYGTETEKEMLHHLCNLHFSQFPLLCVRVIDTEKSANVTAKDLKLLTIDDTGCDVTSVIEEVGIENETEVDQSNEISPDLTAIASELGIDVDGMEGCLTVIENETEPIESRLPNAQFSRDEDDEAPVCITSEIITSTKDQGTKDVNVPIGQLPIELVQGNHNAAQKENATEPAKDVSPSTPQNNTVIVPPVLENKTDTPLRTVHKLPQIVPINRSASSTVLKQQKVSVIKRLDSVTQPSNDNATQPSTVNVHSLKQVCSPQPVQNKVLVGLPVIENTPQAQTSVMPSIQDVVSLKQTEKDGDAQKTETEPSWLESDSGSKCSLMISDVRSLSADKIVSVGEIANNEKVNLNSGNSEKSAADSRESKTTKATERASSPEIIILEPEDQNKNASELIELCDSDEDEAAKKKTSTEKVQYDLNIRQQMERLRSKIESETDCLLLDDTTQDCSHSSNDIVSLSTSGGTSQETTQNTNESSVSLDSQKTVNEEPSETSVDTNGETGEKQVDENGKDDTSPSEEKKVDGENVNTEEQSNKLTLAGKDLFVCGNGTCGFAADDDAELKVHLFVCDYSRDSSTLTCPHCGKQIKYSSAYVDHLKLHGEKKYTCGMCNFASALEVGMSRHVKQKHRCNQVRTVPCSSKKKGYFIMYPKNYKKEVKEAGTNIFSPGDEDKLPLQSIYQENVNCAKCPYFTKVRSNMVRHLKIHIKSVETEGSIVVPSTAPTNPVPCLDTKEKMFDKMTNLAASSQLAQANKDKSDLLTPEEEAKLPQFVPEQMRHKCCSPDCNYVTVDDNMLKHHIKALHNEINFYSCPHCKETVHVEFRYVNLDKIGQHLKYHDNKLYKCLHCYYFHFQKHVVEKHLSEKHPERRPLVYTVREPRAESASEEDSFSCSDAAVVKMWKCGLCDDFESPAKNPVIDHLTKIHNMRSMYKCKLCDLKTNRRKAFETHFAAYHPGSEVEVLRSMIQVSRPLSSAAQNSSTNSSPSEHFDTTPLWQRDAPRIRHIRGILIEEEEVKTKKTKRFSSVEESCVSAPDTYPPDKFFCPLCIEKKKVFHSKSVESFRTHLYQELNYQQYACILCGKMFVDRKECERHHAKAHPNKDPQIKQTMEDIEIKYWVDKVVAKQQAKISERKRRISLEDSGEESNTKRKKTEAGGIASGDAKKKVNSNKLTRSNSNAELRAESERLKAKKRCADDKEDSAATRSNQPEEIRKCPHCKFKSELTALKTHIQLRHLRMGKFLCPYCGDSFQNEKDARSHCKQEHPNNVPSAKTNPDEQLEELKDDFWLVEYGFGLEKQKPEPADEAEDVESENVRHSFCCRYCVPQVEMVDREAVLEHFMSLHQKKNEPGDVCYQCCLCADRIEDADLLDSHAAEKHPKMSTVYEIVKVNDANKTDCAKCKTGECPEKNVDRVKDGSYLCAQCHAVAASYLDCIDHFNEHYPRYSCSTCFSRFFSEEEVEQHKKKSRHFLPYSMVLPSENDLDDYKAGVKIKKNGGWVSLGVPVKSEFDGPVEKKFEFGR